MGNNVKAYKPSGIENVEAMLVSDETVEDAVIWCRSQLSPYQKQKDPEDVSRYILVPTLGGVIKVRFGDYLVQDYRGRYHSMPAKIFEKQFTEIQHLR